MKKSVKVQILGYLGEIIFILVLSTVAYISLIHGPIASYAAIALENEKSDLDLQVLYGKETDLVKYSDNLLAKGTLSVRNPNRHAVTAEVSFVISNTVNLDDMDIVVNGIPLDLSNKTIEDDCYVIPVKKYEMSEYETIAFATGIYGDANNTASFDYRYSVKESFYH